MDVALCGLDVGVSHRLLDMHQGRPCCNLPSPVRVTQRMEDVTTCDGVVVIRGELTDVVELTGYTLTVVPVVPKDQIVGPCTI